MAERFREVVYYEHAEVCLLSAFEPVRVLLWAPCFETESEVLAGWTVQHYGYFQEHLVLITEAEFAQVLQSLE